MRAKINFKRASESQIRRTLRRSAKREGESFMPLLEQPRCQSVSPALNPPSVPELQRSQVIDCGFDTTHEELRTRNEELPIGTVIALNPVMNSLNMSKGFRTSDDVGLWTMDFRTGVGAAALAFVGFGVGHLVQADATSGLALEWIPMRSLFSPGTALLEFALAAGFLFRATRPYAGWIAVAFLIAIFAGNVYASSMGPAPLELGAAIQALLVAGIYAACVRPPEAASFRSATLT